MTIVLWVVLSAMIVVVAVGLAIPLVRRYDAAGHDGETVTGVLRAQLDDVDRQVASGEVDADAAAALRTELKRRLLVESRARSLPVRLLADRSASRLALLLAATTALAATGIYAVTGRPELSAAGAARIVAGETAAVTGTAPSTPDPAAAGIAQLEAATRQSPNDVEVWRTLATAYFADQRFADAARAYGTASALRPADASLRSAQGEALTQVAGGVVTDDAARTFTAARGIDPADPRARYFLALARDQHGDHRGAVDNWVQLINDAPAGAPWEPELRRFVVKAAADAHVDVAGRLKAEAPILAGAANARGPDAATVQAASGMTDAARTAFIRGMVDNLAAKLAANPRDADGWIRLIRSRRMLGDMAAAKAARDTGMAAFRDDPATAKSIGDAAAGLGVG